MSRGSKVIILIGLGVVAIGLIVYFIFVPLFMDDRLATNKNVNTPIANTNNPPVNTNNPEPVFSVPPPTEVSAEAKQTIAARTIAQTFAARLTTYNNQNNLSNFSDLQIISTPAVWSYLDGDYRLALQKNMPAVKDYYAVTGTVVNINSTIINETEATALVMVQKVESGFVSKTSYTTLDLKLKLINGAWLVSWLEWKE